MIRYVRFKGVVYKLQGFKVTKLLDFADKIANSANITIFFSTLNSFYLMNALKPITIRLLLQD